MLLDEAITLIQADINDASVDWNTPLGTAYKLSFQAANYIQLARVCDPHSVPQRLYGETLPSDSP